MNNMRRDMGKAAAVSAVLGLIVALYIEFLFPATPALFYRLYHLTGFGLFYDLYGVLNFAAGYFRLLDPRWPVALAACLAVFLPCAAASLITVYWLGRGRR